MLKYGYTHKGECIYFRKINHKKIRTKNMGKTIGEVATIRTGVVTARKKVEQNAIIRYQYKMLNLKCVASEGYINKEYVEDYESSLPLKLDCLTQMGDILVRLSAPYTAVLIKEQDLCGLVIPSHFAIIRVNRRIVLPEYMYWTLGRDKINVRIKQNSSGSTAFGTISSGAIAGLPIRIIPIEMQRVLGELLRLTEREQELLYKLSTEKEKYNKELINRIYNTIKEGK